MMNALNIFSRYVKSLHQDDINFIISALPENAVMKHYDGFSLDNIFTSGILPSSDHDDICWIISESLLSLNDIADTQYFFIVALLYLWSFANEPYRKGSYSIKDNCLEYFLYKMICIEAVDNNDVLEYMKFINGLFLTTIKDVPQDQLSEFNQIDYLMKFAIIFMQ